jgi:hypothetical protein
MAIDLRRVVLAAVQAALEEPDPGPAKKQRKKRLSGGRAVLIGAGLMTAGRLAAAGRGRGMLESLQERLGDQDPPDDESFDADADEEFEDDPEAEGADLDEDEPLEEEEDEEEEEPEAGADDEPVSEGSAGGSRRRGGRTRA